jgi:hypothetical protein
MRFHVTSLVLIASGALCLHAAAQDSVSKLHAVPGDAVDAHAVAEQVNDYVVDQGALHSSWSNVFGVAPIIKVSAEKALAPTFFTGQESAQALSRLMKSNTAFARTAYALWNGQGFGINNDPTKNNPPVALNTTGFTGLQFGCAFSEFSTGNTNPNGINAPLNNIIGGIVNLQSTRPSRLYVSRINAAVNGVSDNCNLAAFGLGDVDDDGFVHFRADNFNAVDCGGGLALTGNNLFRVGLLGRSGAMVNVIGDGGPTDAAATAWLAMHDMASTINTPNGIPKSLQGTRPIAIDTNFAIQYLFEQAAGTLTLDAPLAHLAAGLTDNRGNLGYTPLNFPTLFTASSICGTAGQVAKGSGPLTDSINMFGLDGTGQFVSPLSRQLPAAISDCDQPSWSNTNVPGTQQFDHYHGSIAFNGGNGQVSLGKDQAGNLLAAATVYYGGVSNLDKNNYIAVARTTPGGTTTWGVAGWTQETTTPPVSDGKIIYQGGTAPIGRLTGALFGPALGAPMIDSVGNVWFLAGITLNGPPVTSAVGLVRAIYNTTTGCYRLELVMKEGDVVKGQNSATNYKINFLTINGGTTVSPGTAWSGNISSAASLNINPSTLDTRDARTLGGIVISAQIVYDVNNDGQFIKSTGAGGVPGSPDEDYQVLLYLSASKDCNSNGIPDDADIASGTSLDANGDGVPDECFSGVGPDVCRPGIDFTTPPCPCANPPTTSGAGCNGLSPGAVPTGGALMSSSGTASLAGTNPGVDTLRISVTGLPTAATESCFLIQGPILNATPLTFGQGLRCVSGLLKRLQLHGNSPGTSTWPAPGDFAPTIQARSAMLGDPLSPGSVRHYFIQYRGTNIPPPCVFPTNFNCSQAQTITWTP